MLRPRYPIREPEEPLPIPGKGYITPPISLSSRGEAAGYPQPLGPHTAGPVVGADLCGQLGLRSTGRFQSDSRTSRSRRSSSVPIRHLPNSPMRLFPSTWLPVACGKAATSVSCVAMCPAAAGLLALAGDRGVLGCVAATTDECADRIRSVARNAGGGLASHGMRVPDCLSGLGGMRGNEREAPQTRIADGRGGRVYGRRPAGVRPWRGSS